MALSELHCESSASTDIVTLSLVLANLGVLATILVLPDIRK